MQIIRWGNCPQLRLADYRNKVFNILIFFSPHHIFHIFSEMEKKTHTQNTGLCYGEETIVKEEKIIAHKCKYDFLVSISNHVLVFTPLNYDVSLITTGM